MNNFELLEKKELKEVEKDIAKKWKDMDILNLSIKNREDNDNFVFYDGPATANGMPGIHHVLAKLLKDSICKYKTMKGFKVLRKIGWDTHGLPVEIEVEKQLGLNNKKAIEEYGLSEFNEKCRNSVWKNEEAFRNLTERMGQFIDVKNPYVTYDNNFIETEWWILKKFFDEGYIYEGHKILPYCPRCGTGLASHEVAQGYKEVSVDTVTVPMKVKGEDTYLLVWTTTPWTLLSNVAVAVNPTVEYLLVYSKGNKFYVAKNLADKILGDSYEVISEFLGKDLEYKEYEQLMPFLNVDKKAFFVVCADYVTTEDGTGLVHIAPAFGEDDYKLGRKYNLPVLNPVDEEGKYTEGPFIGTFVIDADLDVIKYLKANDKLFKKERIKHNYPHCWRCKTPLLYYAKPSWYIETTKLKDKLISENNKVNWHPNFVGEKRFGNWLNNLNDWAISRSRYWGTPFPIWRCECGHVDAIGSREELVERAIENIDSSIELHRPYVDDVHIKCDKCGKKMKRVNDVIDCWFDSGSMPFSQYHYPFENKELFESQFPADFISEGIDQTRGWFYSLLAISTFVMGKAPYKNVLVNDLLLDKDGQKMSKSKGNTLNPFELFDEFGVDVVRWYMLYVSPVWTPLKFDVKGLKEVHSKFFNTFRNTYNFFAMYAEADNVDPRTFEVDYNDRNEIDKWLLSKYNTLVIDVTKNMDDYDMTKAVRSIQNFVSEDLSNWYIRRNRRRFWASELDIDKKAVYKTTYEVLLGLCKLIAPIVPYLSEEMYIKLTNLKSVHLENYPIGDSKYVNLVIEERMDLIRKTISLGRNARESSGIKVRQPISEVYIDGKNKDLINDLIPLVEEELNVKKVIFVNDVSKYMNYNIKPNFKNAGPIFGPKIKLFVEYLKNISSKEFEKLQNKEEIVVNIDNNEYIINYNMIDIRIEAKEGYNAVMEDNIFVILNNELSKELLDEGIAREIVSKVQQMRKNNDYDILDRINIIYNSNELKEIIEKYSDFIKTETLCNEFIEDSTLLKEYDLNSVTAGLKVEKNL